MIFHTVHCHSVADSLCLKSLVWAKYQLHGFHGNKSRRQYVGLFNRVRFFMKHSVYTPLFAKWQPWMEH